MKIKFDYRFDKSGFFKNSQRRAALEKAGDLWEAKLKDDFPDLPAGVKFTISNPQTGVDEIVTLKEKVDDIIIFVGASTFGSSSFTATTETIAQAQVDGVDAAGDVFGSRISYSFRNNNDPVSNFEPWAGSISFGSSVDWDFSLKNLNPNKTDFISVAAHEIGHILGIGTAPIFLELAQGGFFNGINAKKVNGNKPIPLESDLGHVREGFKNDTILLDPIYGGIRKPSQVDLALLADIGYEIAGFQTQGSTPKIVSNKAETIYGTIVGDRIDGLGGNDTLLGDAGNDTLNGGYGNDYLFGEKGNDVFVFKPNNGNDSILDFAVNDDFIQLPANSGINSSLKAVNKLDRLSKTNDGYLVSELKLNSGNILTIYHDKPLKTKNFVIKSTKSSQSIDFQPKKLNSSLENRDTLTGAKINASNRETSFSVTTEDLATVTENSELLRLDFAEIDLPSITQFSNGLDYLNSQYSTDSIFWQDRAIDDNIFPCTQNHLIEA